MHLFILHVTRSEEQVVCLYPIECYWGYSHIRCLTNEKLKIRDHQRVYRFGDRLIFINPTGKDNAFPIGTIASISCWQITQEICDAIIKYNQ